MALATPMPPSVVALVLAGGQSRRMGTDKALLVWDGDPLLSRVCRVALSCADQVYVVTPWGDRYRSLLPSTVQLWPESTSLDPDGSRPGPLVAISSVVNTLATRPPDHQPQWVLALACDMPHLAQTALPQWRYHLAQLSPSVLAYVPRPGHRWEPLCGFYRLACGASWQAYLATGQRSFQAWLNQLPPSAAAVIPDVDPNGLMNLNEPDDLAQAQKA
ncbi:MAG: molybdenum cofactor guanylyltransferase [Leptolyngbya sp.]|nr:molybdenum cofactor guanylyltransferase [Leptolyngbya sp.]